MLELSEVQDRRYKILNRKGNIWRHQTGWELNVIAISAEQTQRHAPGICIAMLELKREV